MAEKYFNITPYAYVSNNPLIFIDPSGMSQVETQFGKLEGTTIFSDGYDDGDDDKGEKRAYLMIPNPLAPSYLFMPMTDLNAKNQNNLQESDLAQSGGDKIDTRLTTWGTIFSIGGLHLGSHMKNVARFGPITTLDGRVIVSATSQYKFGLIPGPQAIKLGTGLRIGGGLLGVTGIAWNAHLLSTNQISASEGWTNIISGGVSLFGVAGMAVTGVYHSKDLFLKYGDSTDVLTEINANTRNGVWWGAYNQFK
jgi:hypothetical protein